MRVQWRSVLSTAKSVNGVTVRLTAELLAVREIEPGKHLVVVYKEQGLDDGFV